MHVPPGSKHGWRKIDTFRAVFTHLATPSGTPRILCGDFNEPRSETQQGVVTWAEKNKYARKDPKKWAEAVERVLLGLSQFDLTDVFREVPAEDLQELWSVRIGNTRRRYDHIFASKSLRAASADYIPWNADLSDHRPVLVEFNSAKRS